MSATQSFGKIEIHANVCAPDLEEEQMREIAEKIADAIKECASTEIEEPMIAAVLGITTIELEVEEEGEPAPDAEADLDAISEEEIREPSQEEIDAWLA